MQHPYGLGSRDAIHGGLRITRCYAIGVGRKVAVIARRRAMRRRGAKAVRYAPTPAHASTSFYRPWHCAIAQTHSTAPVGGIARPLDGGIA